MTVTLVPIDRSSKIDVPSDPDHAELLDDVVRQTRTLYGAIGYQPPWIGYLALDGNRLVGTCAFKAPPREGQVEIAYFTFPGNEGKGYATAMARELMKTAAGVHPRVAVIAHTQPEENASTAILRKIGFELVGPVDDPHDGTIWQWRLATE